MAQFLDMEAVESAGEYSEQEEMEVEEMDEEEEEMSEVEGSESEATTQPPTRSSRNGKAQRNVKAAGTGNAPGVKAKAKPKRNGLKPKPKKLQTISSDEEEDVPHQESTTRSRKNAQKRAQATHEISSDSDDPGSGVRRAPAEAVASSAKGRAKATAAFAAAESEVSGCGVGDGGVKMATSAVSVSKKKPTSGSSEPSTSTGKRYHQQQQHNAASAKKQKLAVVEDSDVEEVEDGEVQENPSSPNPPQDPLVYSSQKAMSMLEKVCDALDIKWQGYDIKPDSAIWTKIGGIYMRKKHADYRLTFSSFDSFNGQIGRFLAAMIYAKSGLEPKFIPGGVFVWRHEWFVDGVGEGEPKCMHGTEMVLKPRSIELNPSSEAGKRAIAEQNASVEKNRFGRQVVVIRFDNNAVCFKDANHQGFPHPHAHGSCAMVFSDLQKAMSAMKHDIDWTLALYPNADKKKATECVLISAACNCNYASESPISGRQLPKMTPYKLSGIDDISREMAKSRKDMAAHKSNPHTMVYTCCNPQSPGGTGGARGGGSGGGGKGKAEKSCPWRISAMDLRYAYVIANELFGSVFGKTAPANLQQFKWSDSYAFKTDVITPVCPLDSQDPFA